MAGGYPNTRLASGGRVRIYCHAIDPKPERIGDAGHKPAAVSAVEPPVIQINGGNPAIIHVGDSYADLGAAITGPQADLNLGIQKFVKRH